MAELNGIKYFWIVLFMNFVMNFCKSPYIFFSQTKTFHIVLHGYKIFYKCGCIWNGHNKDQLLALVITIMQRCWYVRSPTRKETSYSDRRFWVSYILFVIKIGGILELFICHIYIYIYIYIYLTRLVSNEIFSPSKKIHREVGRVRTYQHPSKVEFHMALTMVQHI
jgi:uncharacterized protein YhhL (DUF1145 family)